MTDHDPTYVPPPVMPSIGHSHSAIKDTAGELALAYRVIDGLLEALGTHGTTLETFRTDMRKPATIDPHGNQYDVRRGS